MEDTEDGDGWRLEGEPSLNNLDIEQPSPAQPSPAQPSPAALLPSVKVLRGGTAY